MSSAHRVSSSWWRKGFKISPDSRVGGGESRLPGDGHRESWPLLATLLLGISLEWTPLLLNNTFPHEDPWFGEWRKSLISVSRPSAHLLKWSLEQERDLHSPKWPRAEGRSLNPHVDRGSRTKKMRANRLMSVQGSRGRREDLIDMFL